MRYAEAYGRRLVGHELVFGVSFLVCSFVFFVYIFFFFWGGGGFLFFLCWLGLVCVALVCVGLILV